MHFPLSQHRRIGLLELLFTGEYEILEEDEEARWLHSQVLRRGNGENCTADQYVQNKSIRGGKSDVAASDAGLQAARL